MKPWVPILSPASAAAAAARDAVDAIAQAVTERSYPPGRRLGRGEEEALLYAYLAVARGDLAWAGRATERLNEVIDQAAEQKTRWLALYGGLCGLGFTVEHLSRLLEGTFPAGVEEASGPEHDSEAEQDDDLNAEIDAAALLELRRTPVGSWSRDYDLINGLVGYGVYFLERWPGAASAEALKLLIDHLEALAKPMDPGVAWYSGPGLLPQWQRELCPEGYFNLGVAHGIPGIIHLLDEVAAVGVERGRAERLLEGAVDWLMAQKRPSGSRSWFSAWLAPGESKDSRLTWCYGDLGILSLLLQVARRSDREDWHRFAHDLLDHCLAWPAEAAGIEEAPICHGAAGAAHVFNRIYQAEGDPRCRDAALMWYDRALAMRRPGSGVGGYLSLYSPDPSSPLTWEANPAFLDGAIGVALAFTSALSGIEPGWDRLLLMSGRSWSEAGAEGARSASDQGVRSE